MTVNGEQGTLRAVRVTQHLERDPEGNRVPGNQEFEIQAAFRLTQLDLVYQWLGVPLHVVLDDGRSGTAYVQKYQYDAIGVLVWLLGVEPFVQPS